MTDYHLHNIIDLHIQPEANMVNASKSRRNGEEVVATATETPRKKNFRLRQSKIDQAMAILGTSTETETIEQALDMIVFRREQLDGIDALFGKGIVNVFEADEE